MAIAFSHAGSGTGKGATSVAATVTINANDTVVVAISIHGNTSPSSVTDSGGSVYKFRFPGQNNGTSDRVELWSTDASSAKAGTSVTVQFAAATTYVVAVATYTGVLRLGNLNVLTGSSTTPNESFNIYVTEPNNWIVLASSDVGTATYSATSPNVVRASAATSGGSGSTNQGGAIGDSGALANTGFQGPSFTLSASSVWATVGMELQGSLPFLTYMCGFELGSTGEPHAITGIPTVQTSIIHGGTYALQCNPTAASTYASFQQFSNGPFSLAQPIFCSTRFYLNVASLPNIATAIYTALRNGIVDESLILNTDGSLTVKDASGTTAASTLKLSTGQWHQISFEILPTEPFPITPDGLLAVYVDGVQWAQLTSANTGFGGDTARLGAGTDSTTPTCNLFFDDAIWSNGDQIIGPGQQVVLLPTADSAIGNWTGGAGGVTNLWQGVDNVPPVGKAAGSETNTTQIKNANATVPSDYTATCQSYSVKGIAAGSTINAVGAVCTDGVEATSPATFGKTWVASNPAQSVPADVNGFEYGLAGTLGSFPSGWNVDEGALSANPSVTLSTAPTVTVRKITSTAVADDGCFLGVYVDYLPKVQ